MALFAKIAAGKVKAKKTKNLTATKTGARDLAEITGGMAAKTVGKPGGDMMARIRESLGQKGNVSMQRYVQGAAKKGGAKGATPQFIVPESDEEMMKQLYRLK